jgi:hypothetical protein
MINPLYRPNTGIEVLPLSVEAVNLPVIFVAVALQWKVGLRTVGHGVLEVLTLHDAFLDVPKEVVMDLVFYSRVDQSYEESLVVDEVTGDKRVRKVVVNGGRCFCWEV